jgi:hypothetical protein
MCRIFLRNLTKEELYKWDIVTPQPANDGPPTTAPINAKRLRELARTNAAWYVEFSAALDDEIACRMEDDPL